jgi:hypothetical protein
MPKPERQAPEPKMPLSAEIVSKPLLRTALVALGAAAVLGAHSPPNASAADQATHANGPATSSKTGEAAQPADPGGTPSAGTTKSVPDWPKILPEPRAEKVTQPEPEVWPAEEIIRAKAHCENILRSVQAVTIPAEPIKQGECGSPAPVLLVSVGRNPEVVLSPPALLTCDMVAAFAEWIREDVQPLAKTHLGAAIVRVETMSSYSCRNAYNRKRTRLSEHGRANALDLRRFGTSTGVDIDLLAHWGMTARDVRAAVAAAKAAEEKRAADQQAKSKPQTAGQSNASVSSGPQLEPPGQSKAQTSADRMGFRSQTLIEGINPVSRGAASSKVPPVSSEADAGSPHRLGGPRATAASEVGALPEANSQHTRFLRAAHVAACRRFGTVLGPEANEAHRDHFHLDMAERTSGSFCE